MEDTVPGFLKKRSPELSILEVVHGRCRQHIRGVVTGEVKVNVVDPMPICAVKKGGSTMPGSHESTRARLRLPIERYRPQDETKLSQMQKSLIRYGACGGALLRFLCDDGLNGPRAV